MNANQLKEFKSNNSKDQIKEYYDTCYHQLKDLNKRCKQVTFFGLLCMVMYFICLHAKSIEVDIGLIKISDLTLIIKAIPLVFSYFLWEWSLTDMYRGGVRQTVAELSKEIYSIPDIKNDNLYQNPYIKDLLPFSLISEFFSFGGFDSIWSGILWFTNFILIYTIPTSFLSMTIIHSFVTYKWEFWNIMFSGSAILFLIYCYIFQFKKFSRNAKM